MAVSSFRFMCSNVDNSLKGLTLITTYRGHNENEIRSVTLSFDGGFSDLRVEDLEDITEVFVGEDDRGVSLKLRDDLIKVGLVDPSVVRLSGVRSISFGGLGVELLDSLLHHGVLTTDHEGVLGSHGLSHNANLLGGDVIGVNEHHLGVFSASVLAFIPKLALSLLGFLSGTHYLF